MEIKFPANFVFGAATSAYQIEGATEEDGRGPIFFDQIFKPPLFDFDPNIACDHYHRYKEDVQLMKQLGLQSYRFSIAWTRLYPSGSGNLNEKGIRFYDNLINELLAANIEPLATLHHFDLPRSFYAKGWRNPETQTAFSQFARTCFEKFGDRVTHWITFNEPWVDQYMIPSMVQDFTTPKITQKQDKRLFAKCLNNLHGLFQAHARVIETCREIIDNAKIGITLNLAPASPVSQSEEDEIAARHYDGFMNTWHLNLALSGDYPKDLFTYFQDTVESPKITAEEMKFLKRNESDFIGVNYYGPTYIKASVKHFPLNFEEYKEDHSRSWANNAKVVPEAFYEILTRIAKEYDSPVIYITENGCSFGDEHLNDEKDQWRIDYLQRHLREVSRAIKDGAKIERYYVWSLLDNLEWAQGYVERYGLIYIDRTADLRRTIKKSGYWYAKLIERYIL